MSQARINCISDIAKSRYWVVLTIERQVKPSFAMSLSIDWTIARVYSCRFNFRGNILFAMLPTASIIVTTVLLYLLLLSKLKFVLSTLNSAPKMTTPDELTPKQETFDDAGYLKRNHAEGAIIHSVPATVFVVRDEFVSTVCSGCLKTGHPQSTTQLQRCSSCKFLNYCSRECQVRNWPHQIVLSDS